MNKRRVSPIAALALFPAIAFSAGPALASDVPCAPGACIDNGTILLAVNPEGHLNITNTGDIPLRWGGSSNKALGLTYIPTGSESTAPGCLCEGWGVADAAGGVAGYANVSTDGGAQNMTVDSFTATASTAVSTVTIGHEGTPTFQVTHDYHPAPATANLYEATVSIKNVSPATVTDVRYRRVMDWDIEPTPFQEYVTIEQGTAKNLLFSSDQGFATANPLGGPAEILFTGEAVDSGPTDHGALFDFGFGALEPGKSVSFKIYYGAADTEAAALDAITKVGAEAFSLGQPSSTDGPTLGAPNTFVFAFSGVGGKPVFNRAPEATAQSVTTAQDTAKAITLSGSDPDGDALTYAVLTPPAHGTLTGSGADLTYKPAGGFVGPDSFTFKANDGALDSSPATVSISVTAAVPAKTATETLLVVSPIKKVTPERRLKLVAKVTPDTATGLVRFTASGRVLATATLRQGIAGVRIKGGLYGGTNTIVAEYLGDKTMAGSVSAQVTIKVRDKKKPSITRFALARSAASPTATFRVRDAGGVAETHIRYRMAQSGGAKLGAWSPVSVLTGAASSWTGSAAPSGSRMCVSVRAKDYAGNVSGWKTKCRTLR